MVPISATMAASEVPVPSSTGIRAPLTLDDSDFEYSVSTSGKKDGTFSSSNSDSEILSDGFVSGEDEFEMDSKRPFVSGSDGGILEETHFVKKYVLNRPLVKYPDEEFIQESSNVRAFDDFWPLSFDPNEEVVEDNDNLEECSDRSPSAAATDDGTLGEGERMDGSYIDSRVSDTGTSGLPKPRMPIAQLSWDSDDDSVGSETSEEESFSGTVRVPDSGFQRRFGNAPKVRVLDVGDVEDSASQTENLSQEGTFEESIMEGGDNEVMNFSCEENDLVIEEMIVPDSTLAAAIENKDPVITEQLEGEDLEEGIKEPDPSNLIVGGTNYANMLGDSGSLVAECILPCEAREAEALEVQAVENMGLASMDSAGHRNENLNTKGTVACSRNNENMMNEIEQNEVESHGCKGSNNIEYVHGAMVLESIYDAELSEKGVTEQSKCLEHVCFSDIPESLVMEDELHVESNISQALYQSSSCEPEKSSEVNNDSVPTEDAELLHFDATQSLNISGAKRMDTKDQLEEPMSECFENVHFSDVTESLTKEDKLHGESNISQALHQCSNSEPETSPEVNNHSVLTGEEKGFLQVDTSQSLNLGGPEMVNTSDHQEEHMSSGSLSCGVSSQNHLQFFDTMTRADSKDEPNTIADLKEEEITDSSALAALDRASTGIGLEGDSVTFMSADRTRLISLAQPASFGSTVHSLGPATQLNSAILIGPPEHVAAGESNEFLSEEEKKKLEKLQQIRVKYLRLVHRLKQSLEDSIPAKVLYQLLLTSGRPSAQEFSFDFAKQAAMELEAEGNNDLDFSLNVIVIGKSGVGKSATINSIFGEDKAVTNAFEPGTTGLREVQGTLDGIRVRVLDTPGLRSSVMEQSTNRKILLSIKKIMKKFSPDIVLYVDRLDLQTRDLNDLPLFKLITSYLGSSIWFRTILNLTHAASPPPEGQLGHVISHELFVAQRSHAVRQLISLSVGDPHIIKPGLIPVSLVENHSILEMKESDHILPSYEDSWRSKLLCLCYSVKILHEIHSTIQPKGTLLHDKFLGPRVPRLPLPYFLSSLLQSSAHPKLSTALGGEVDSDIELAYLSKCDEESEDEHDQLPAFMPLRKSQIAQLDEQRKAYYAECDYRVKLLQKKQLKEEVRRARDIKKKRKEGIETYANAEVDLDQKMNSPEALAVPLPDMALPPAFDGENPAYRYRFLEMPSRIMTRPVLASHGWDHDCGFDGVNIEDNLTIAGQFPAVITVQLTKDKKVFNTRLNSSVSAKHGEKGSSMAGLDIDTIGKQLVYSLKTETKMKIFRVNKSAAGISISFLGGNVITGLKVEDQVAVGKNLILVGSTGLSLCQSDAAYGTNLAIRFKDKDYPLEEDQNLIGVSVMRWRGENVFGLNLQCQLSLGPNSKLGVRAGLNSKKSGQVSVKISSSNDLHIAILGLLPIAKAITRYIFYRQVKDSHRD